jgi:hypothetical protein
MEVAQVKSASNLQPLIFIGKTILALMWSLTKKTFQFGQKFRKIMAFSAAYTESYADIINNLKIQADEISKLKEKILILEEKNIATEAIKKQVFESQCRLILLEKGRKLTQRRTY